MFAVLLGSDLFVGTSGVLAVETKNGQKDFFRVRELHRERGAGSYPVVDCDIKDATGTREIKLAKSRPVAGSSEIDVTTEKGLTVANRRDKSLVLRVEEITKKELCGILDQRHTAPPPEHARELFATLPEEVRQAIEGAAPPAPAGLKDAIRECAGAIRITGDFHAGGFRVVATEHEITVYRVAFIGIGNTHVGSGPIRLGPRGISM